MLVDMFAAAVNKSANHPPEQPKPSRPLASPVAAAGHAGPLRLLLYGPMRVVDWRGTDLTPRIRKSRAVLAVLALAAPRPVLRDHLATLLWSLRDRDQGRSSLRQCVHEIQGILAAVGLTALIAERNHLLLDNRCISVDAWPGSLSALQLLSDLDGLDPAFDRWLFTERRRLGRAAISVAEGALADGTSGALDAPLAVAAAEQLLAVDPVNEAAWRVVIAGHIALGRPAAAMEAIAVANPPAFNKRNSDTPEYASLETLIGDTMAQLETLSTESYGGTYADGALIWSDIAPRGIFPGLRQTWIWFMQYTDGFYIRPIGLEMLLEHSGTDSSTWSVLQVRTKRTEG